MKIKKILNYITLFTIFILIFALNLACSKTSIEEDIEADIEEKYLSEIDLISMALTNSTKRLTQATSDFVEGKISLTARKAMTMKYIGEIKALYDTYLELKPPKRLEKFNDLYGKAMDHLLKSAIFLQYYINTDDIDEMIGYLMQSNIELDLVTEYILKATEQVKKITE